MRADVEVPLTARLFDTLLYMVQNPDRLLMRGELEQAVWQGQVVAHGNLPKAISSLRKTFQDKDPAETFIVTVSGRGFRFAMPVFFESNSDFSSLGGPFVGSVSAASEPSRAFPWLRSWVLAAVSITLILLFGITASTFNRSHEVALPVPFTPPPRSVAVMAFTNLSGDQGQDYFSDGFSEELINALSRVTTLQIAARQSSFSFKAKAATVSDIARQLNVSTVLEGSVRRLGTRLRITARLISGQTGYQLWARDFERTDPDTLQVQAEIAQAVATSLQVILPEGDVAKLTLGGTANPQASDAYLHAMTLKSNPLTPENLRQTLAALNQSLALDPNYALAYVERASTMINFVEGFGGLGSDLASVQGFRTRALADAERAVLLAPQLGAGHAILAAVDEELWRFGAAEAEYNRARALTSGDARIERRFARFEAAMGRSARAVAAAARAVLLDPLSAGAYDQLASTLTLADQPDEAAIALHHAEQLGFAGLPDADRAAEIELLKHNFLAVRKICSAEHDWVQEYYLAIADHALGNQVEAVAVLARFQAEQGESSAFQYAAIYAQWGERQSALRWLETAYDVHDDGLIDMQADWLVDPIRNTAQFKAIEQRMNFSP